LHRVHLDTVLGFLLPLLHGMEERVGERRRTAVSGLVQLPLSPLVPRGATESKRQD
jgi:hypothetical protein